MREALIVTGMKVQEAQFITQARERILGGGKSASSKSKSAESATDQGTNGQADTATELEADQEKSSQAD